LILSSQYGKIVARRGIEAVTGWLKRKKNIRRIGRWCGWMALALLALTLLTGYGISQFRIVDRLTFGLLNKAVAYRLHHYTDVPIIVFALTHVAISVWGRLGRPTKNALR
jgi:hypothetical protein